MDQTTINEVINYLNQSLISYGIHVDSIALFGSALNGNMNIDSDIDLLLVSSLFDTDDDYVLAKPWLYTNKVDFRIEPLSIGLKRFATDDTSPVIELVRQTGIEIHALAI